MKTSNHKLNNLFKLEYETFLSTPRRCEDGNMRMPTKGSTLTAMQTAHAQKSNMVELIDLFNNTPDKNIYFWSDQHFGHSNIIKYSNRPFETKEDMNAKMLENYRKTITDDDVVFFVGDVAFYVTEELIYSLKNLPGKKVLIFGNHDFDKKTHDFVDLKCFDFMAITFAWQDHKRTFNMSHYPIDNEKAHIKQRQENLVYVHGHLHNENIEGNYINVSVENIDYTPISYPDLLTKFNILA